MRILTAAIGVAVCAMASACAESSRDTNPTAPTAVVEDSLASTSDAVSSAQGAKDDKGKPSNPGNGNGNGNGNGRPDNPGNGNGNGPPEAPPGKPENPGRPDSPGNSNPPGNPHVPPPPGNSTPPAPGNTTPPAPGNTTPPAPVVSRVQIQGVIGSVGSDTIDVNGQIVNVVASTVIRQGNRKFVFADLLVGDPVHVVAKRSVSGSGSTATVSIEASEVKLQREEEDEEVEEPTEPPSLLVSVGALDGSAAEAELESGTFRFSRSGDTTASLVVTIEVSGTATSGSDFVALPLTVTFAAGSATADVVVVPLADEVTEVPETVTVTVIDAADYDLGSPATATVTIEG